MDQQSKPSGPNLLIQAANNANANLAYNIKAATGLGVIHVICGFITLGAQITQLFGSNFSFYVWTSVFFFVSGGLAIGGAQNRNKWVMVATMVMVIISAISAGIILIMFTVFTSACIILGFCHFDNLHPLVSLGLLVALAGTMLAILIAIDFASLCCRPSKHDTANLVGASVLCLCHCLCLLLLLLFMEPLP